MLPSIRDMYNCTRENHDYNVIKVYNAKDKNFAMGTKPTKKDHYLNQVTRLNCSPGPASTPSFTTDTANHQNPWLKKNIFQTRRA